MLVFIVPLRSSQTSTSWEQVSKLFERCVKSLCNQTSPEFKVIVVCHERPVTKFEHPQLTYINVDFPIPVWENNSDTYTRETDRSRKIWTGLNNIQQFQPSHVMVVDADDLVSKHLASFVKEHSQSNGWSIETGYECCEGSNRAYYMSNRFYDKCGTSSIIRYELLDSYKKFQFADVKGFQFLHHQSISDLMSKNGTPLEPLPFDGIYIVGHGENLWWASTSLSKMGSKSNFKELLLFRTRRAAKTLLSKRITEVMREEFGLFNL